MLTLFLLVEGVNSYLVMKNNFIPDTYMFAHIDNQKERCFQVARIINFLTKSIFSLLAFHLIGATSNGNCSNLFEK